MAVAPTLEPTYNYEVFRQGTYLGILPKVDSEFTYTQDINTPGTQIVVTTAQDIDTQNQAVVGLTDESSNVLTTEAGIPLTTDRTPDIYGSAIFNSMIQNGNEIRIWEYTKWHPNGVLVFDGRITRYNPHIGNNDSIDLTVCSYGIEADNALLYGSVSPDQVVTAPDPSVGSFAAQNSPFPTAYCAQTFTTGPNVTNISAIVLECIGSFQANTGLFTPGSFAVELYTYSGGNPGGGTFLGTTNSVSVTTNYDDVTAVPPVVASFSSPIAVNPNTGYAFVIVTSSQNIAFVPASSSYTAGTGWQFAASTWTSETYSMVFLTLTDNTNLQFTNSIYFNDDPGSMLSDFMTNYQSLGGKIGTGSIVTTGASATVAFVMNTVLEGIQECLTLAPSGYYWYVDPGSNLLYYQPKSTTPDHVFTFKVHINTFELLIISENTINAAYLTAGNTTDGIPIIAFAQNPDSIAKYGQVLDRITDSRILDAPSAQLVIDNYVATNSVEQSQSTINIFASNYDLTTLKLGQVIGFNGFGSYADNIQLQIVNIERYSEYVTLTLGTLPKRASTKAEKLERSLLSTQTVNNPLSAL